MAGSGRSGPPLPPPPPSSSSMAKSAPRVGLSRALWNQPAAPVPASVGAAPLAGGAAPLAGAAAQAGAGAGGVAAQAGAAAGGPAGVSAAMAGASASQARTRAPSTNKRARDDEGDAMDWIDGHTTLVCNLFAEQVRKGNRPNTHLNNVGFTEVKAAYKQALLKFHPDRVSRSDIHQQVKAEETFKFISRLKEKLFRVF